MRDRSQSLLLVVAVVAVLLLGRLFLQQRNTVVTAGRTVDVAEFDPSLNADDLVLIKFGATWCPPCRALDKELETFDAQAAGVKVVKIDVDERRDLAGKFEVRGIPHMLLVRNGRTLNETSGFYSAQDLQDWITKSPK
jgi:thioredoxin 1